MLHASQALLRACLSRPALASVPAETALFHRAAYCPSPHHSTLTLRAADGGTCLPGARALLRSDAAADTLPSGHLPHACADMARCAERAAGACSRKTQRKSIAARTNICAANSMKLAPLRAGFSGCARCAFWRAAHYAFCRHTTCAIFTF